MKEKVITYKQAALAYCEEGEGPAIVFLHGFCEDHSVWFQEEEHNFVNPFTGNYKVILIDTPGFGKSGLPGDSVISMEFYADGVKAILDAEGVTECRMIGHSMGGYIVLNFANRFPSYIKGLALFHSTSYKDDENKMKDRERVAAFVRTNGVAAFVNELYNNLFGSVYTTTHPESISQLKKHGAEVSTVEGIALASLAMRNREDTTGVLETLNVPFLFIIGKEDKAVSPEKTLPLTHLPDRSVICILEKAAHMGMFEAPGECRKAIEEWLSIID